MTNWLTSELRIMRELYQVEPWAAMRKRLPRHTLSAIRGMALRLDVARPVMQQQAAKWLRLCHEHFERRERGAWR